MTEATSNGDVDFKAIFRLLWSRKITVIIAATTLAVLSVVELLFLPFVALVGFLVYSEDFEVAVLIGAALIFAGNSYSLHRERRPA